MSRHDTCLELLYPRCGFCNADLRERERAPINLQTLKVYCSDNCMGLGEAKEKGLVVAK